MARSAKQRAASRRNLEKARRSKRTSGTASKSSGISPSLGSSAPGTPNKTLSSVGNRRGIDVNVGPRKVAGKSSASSLDAFFNQGFGSPTAKNPSKRKKTALFKMKKAK